MITWVGWYQKKLYITPEKKLKSQYLYLSMIDLHEIWQDDAEHVLKVCGCYKFLF